MDKFNPKVSIIIPVYNGSNYLREAIDSSLKQTYKNIEIIVVNDGSKDNGATERIALSYGDKIRYFSKENGGVATALNLGIQKMTGEYFSWLSHDDFYTPKKIEAQIKVLSKLEDKTTVVVCGYTTVNEKREYLWDVNPYKKYSQEQLDTPLFGLFKGLTNGCCMLIHKSHFEKVGLFDTSLRTTQDYALWFKIMKNNNVKYHKGLYVKSRYHSNQDSKKVDAHSEECSDLWINMMKETTSKEKVQIDGSICLFYKNVYKFLKKNSNYDRAILYAYANMISNLSLKKGQVKYKGKIKRNWNFKKSIVYKTNIQEECKDDGQSTSLAKKVVNFIKYSIEQRGIIRTIGIVVVRVCKKLFKKKDKNEYIEFDYSLEPGKVLHEKNIVKYNINPKISIITAFYNDSKYINQTANSVLNQTFKEFEWIVVNDGSDDEDSIKKLEELSNLDSRIKILNKENEGPAIARDYGVKNSSNNSNYVFILDSDDLIDNTYLECAYWTLQTNKDASWAYTDLVNFYNKQQLWIKKFKVETEKKDNILVNSALIRKKDFLEGQGYNIKEWNVYEDWNFWLKLLAKGKYPVRMNFIGFWYRTKSSEESELARAKVNLEVAMQYINQTAKKVRNNIKAVQYPRSNQKNEEFEFVDNENILIIKDPKDLEKIKEKSVDVLITTIPLSYTTRQEVSKHIEIIYDLTTFLDREYWAEFIKNVIYKMVNKGEN